MENLIFVKLGGGLITDKNKPKTPKLEVINRLTKEITEARKEKRFNLIIGNGAGSFGHIPAKKYNLSQGIINKESEYGLCKVHNEVLGLNKIVVDSLIEKDEKAFSISPSTIFFADNFKIIDAHLKIIKKLLEYNAVPVLHGDTIIDFKKGCFIFSTEDLFVYLARILKPKKIIFANKVDGVFTDDPIKNKKAQFIPKINKKNWQQVKKYLKGSDGIDVTGGMAQKVEKALNWRKPAAKFLLLTETSLII